MIKSLNRFLLVAAGSPGLGLCLSTARTRQSDNRDGTFANLPLDADYPDPDIIRASNDFYVTLTNCRQQLAGEHSEVRRRKVLTAGGLVESVKPLRLRGQPGMPVNKLK